MGSGTRLAALDQLADLLAALAADLLVERVAALVTDGDAALAARLRDRHRAPRRRGSIRAVPLLGRSLLALLDELADLVPALAADLLVERRAALGLDRLAALLADLL